MKTRQHRNLYTNVHISIILNSQQIEATQMPINKWINKIWYSQIMEYYAAIKGNEVITCVTIWRNLENIMLKKKKLDTTDHV